MTCHNAMQLSAVHTYSAPSRAVQSGPLLPICSHCRRSPHPSEAAGQPAYRRRWRPGGLPATRSRPANNSLAPATVSTRALSAADQRAAHHALRHELVSARVTTPTRRVAATPVTESDEQTVINAGLRAQGLPLGCEAQSENCLVVEEVARGPESTPQIETVR
jgi:hypothetical protein